MSGQAAALRKPGSSNSAPSTVKYYNNTTTNPFGVSLTAPKWAPSYKMYLNSLNR